MTCSSCNSEFGRGSIEGTAVQSTLQCNNCGAPFQSVRNMTSDFCESCESSIVNDEMLASMTQPNYIIPFNISKAEAEHNFRKWLSTRPLAPTELRRNIKIANRNTYLMPFWCFDYNNEGTMIFDATQSRHYTRGDYDITEIKHFDMEVSGRVVNEMIPADAMQELSDTYMEYISPFDNSELVEFSPCVLSGTRSKKYDYSASQVESTADELNQRFTEEVFSNACKGGYSVSGVKEDNVTKEITKRCLVYYPLYIFNCTFNGNEYEFYMNGQTGQIAGETPISVKRVLQEIFMPVILTIIAAFIGFILGFDTGGTSQIILESVILTGYIIFVLGNFGERIGGKN